MAKPPPPGPPPPTRWQVIDRLQAALTEASHHYSWTPSLSETARIDYYHRKLKGTVETIIHELQQPERDAAAKEIWLDQQAKAKEAAAQAKAEQPPPSPPTPPAVG